jgi:hypothetical protein
LKYKHIENVEVTNVEFSDDKKFRYRLEIQLKNKSEGKTVCVIMQNPSYADRNIADKSVNFLEKLIFEKKYKEFSNVYKIIIVNQFAYIQTNDFSGLNEQIGEKNNNIIEKSIDVADIILIAWGKSNSFHNRIKFVNEILKKKQKKCYVTKKHPSRGFYDNFIEEYNV